MVSASNNSTPTLHKKNDKCGEYVENKSQISRCTSKSGIYYLERAW